MQDPLEEDEQPQEDYLLKEKPTSELVDEICGSPPAMTPYYGINPSPSPTTTPTT
jgi:hypothetical protein